MCISPWKNVLASKYDTANLKTDNLSNLAMILLSNGNSAATASNSVFNLSLCLLLGFPACALAGFCLVFSPFGLRFAGVPGVDFGFWTIAGSDGLKWWIYGKLIARIAKREAQVRLGRGHRWMIGSRKWVNSGRRHVRREGFKSRISWALPYFHKYIWPVWRHASNRARWAPSKALACVWLVVQSHKWKGFRWS